MQLKKDRRFLFCSLPAFELLCNGLLKFRCIKAMKRNHPYQAIKTASFLHATCGIISPPATKLTVLLGLCQNFRCCKLRSPQVARSLIWEAQRPFFSSFRPFKELVLLIASLRLHNYWSALSGEKNENDSFPSWDNLQYGSSKRIVAMALPCPNTTHWKNHAVASSGATWHSPFDLWLSINRAIYDGRRNLKRLYAQSTYRRIRPFKLWPYERWIRDALWVYSRMFSCELGVTLNRYKPSQDPWH